MNNTDLLEKLDMIKEAVERNPARWWREFDYKANCSGEQWRPCRSVSDVYVALEFGWYLRLKPQRVKVEGWVDEEVIANAVFMVEQYDESIPAVGLAKSPLDCVKEKSDE